MASEDRSNFPLANVSNDGWSNAEAASSTCFCGAIQISVPIVSPGLLGTFACNCADCHKVCQMQAWNFIADDKYVKYIRGEDNLSTFTTKKTIAAGNDMTNYFCKTCGTLLNRKSSGFPGKSFLRSGTVDDVGVQNGVLRPQMELFIGSRNSCLQPIEGAKQYEGMPN